MKSPAPPVGLPNTAHGWTSTDQTKPVGEKRGWEKINFIKPLIEFVKIWNGRGSGGRKGSAAPVTRNGCASSCLAKGRRSGSGAITDRGATAALRVKRRCSRRNDEFMEAIRPFVREAEPAAPWRPVVFPIANAGITRIHCRRRTFLPRTMFRTEARRICPGIWPRND